jgi:sugar lactone lactonase YvrE
MNTKGAFSKIDSGLPGATAIQLSADQSQLFLANSGQFIYAYQVQPDGTVMYKQPYFDLHLPYGQPTSGATAMATDNQGRLYVATTLGIQIMDQPGRVNGILASPTREPVKSLVWGGADPDTLYAFIGRKLYARRLKTTGVVSSAPPVKLPNPRL